MPDSPSLRSTEGRTRRCSDHCLPILPGRGRPKLYIACGISGQIQHTAGMDQSSMVISINSDPEAPINKIADYAITGDVNEIIPKMIKYYKQNSK